MGAHGPRTMIAMVTMLGISGTLGVAEPTAAASPPAFVAAWGDCGSGNGEFSNGPYSLAVGAGGDIFATDSGNRRVQRFKRNGAFVRAFGPDTPGWDLARPFAIAVGKGDRVYVSDPGWIGGIMSAWTPNGAWLTEWRGGPNGKTFGLVNDIATDAAGTVYVTDPLSDWVWKFDAGGTFLGTWDVSPSPHGIAVGPAGVYVTDSKRMWVTRFSPDGTMLGQFGSPGSGNGQFQSPEQVALDADGNVYVADTGNHRIQKFTSTGQFLTAWGSLGSGNGKFQNPWGVAVDAAGDVYVADTDNCRIQRFGTVAAVTRRPDGRVRRGTSGAWLGNDVYNTTGSGQAVTGTAAPGGSVSFGLSIQNDGTGADRFKVKATGPAAAGYTVKYLHGATDITSAVVAGTHRTPSLKPGATYLVTAKVTVKKNAAARSKVVRVLTSTSLGDSTQKDAVKVTGKRK